LAEACARSDRADEGLALLDEALSLADAWDERWWEPEIRRLRGQLLWDGGSTAEAGVCFESALDLARRQGAKVHELRAARDLARLWAEQGKRQKSLDLLTPVYEWFAEGLDTLDLIEAGQLLDQLR
jgi:predicted ATPase